MSRQFVVAPLVVAAFAAVTLLVPADESRGAMIVVVPNFSYETPNVADNDFTDQGDADPIPGWVFETSGLGFQSGGVWDPRNADYTGTLGDNTALPGTAQGGQAAYLYLEQIDDQDPQPIGGLLRTASPVATVEDNTRYDLTVAIGNAKSFDVGEVTIQLLVGSEVVASEFIEASEIPSDTFTDFTTFFQTGVGDPLTGGDLSIRLLHTTTAAGVHEVEFDNVRLLSTVIPEPGSAALVALAGTVLGLRRRRGRQS